MSAGRGPATQAPEKVAKVAPVIRLSARAGLAYGDQVLVRVERAERETEPKGGGCAVMTNQIVNDARRLRTLNPALAATFGGFEGTTVSTAGYGFGVIAPAASHALPRTTQH